MRFLIDENLSEVLVAGLRDIAPGSLHIRLLGEGGADDARIWQLAREHDCTILTRDEDFLRLSVLNGAPPKVVLIRLGNCATRDVLDLLRGRSDAIVEFLADEDAAFLALG